MFWLRVMSLLSLRLGRRLSRPVVCGIALYFVLAAPAARQASRQYLARALRRAPSWLDLYRHVLSFASTIHDRVYLLNDRHALFDIQVQGQGLLAPEQLKGQGAFLFGGHLGSFEVLRSLARVDPRLKVSIAMYPDNARQINATLNAINPNATQDIIALGQLDAVLAMHQRLKEGALVGILADRAVATEQAQDYQRVEFLGAPARFPLGPFRLAALLRQPVYFMAGLYQGGHRYEVHFERLADEILLCGKDRDALAQALLRHYVATLERHCLASPYNWFNFFDFWDAPDADSN